MLHSDLHPPAGHWWSCRWREAGSLPSNCPKPTSDGQKRHSNETRSIAKVILEPPNSQLKHPKTRCEKCTAETGWNNWWGVEGVKTLSPSLSPSPSALPARALLGARWGLLFFSTFVAFDTRKASPCLPGFSSPINTRSYHSNRGPNIQPSPDSRTPTAPTFSYAEPRRI